LPRALTSSYLLQDELHSLYQVVTRDQNSEIYLVDVSTLSPLSTECLMSSLVTFLYSCAYIPRNMLRVAWNFDPRKKYFLVHNVSRFSAKSLKSL